MHHSSIGSVVFVSSFLALFGCTEDTRPTDTGAPRDSATDVASDASTDAMGDTAVSDASTDARTDGGPLTFSCTMGDLVKGDQCGCLGEAVCVQIHRCLEPTDIAERDASWDPLDTCVEAVRSDCAEDIDDPGLFPTNFVGCMADLQTATCEELGTFMSISDDFPPSCANLRSVETALGITL